MTDEQAVQQFEAFVQGQKPAETPWQPVTDYSFEARRAIEGIHPQLILDHLVCCDDADILDYGCGPSAHLVRLLNEAVVTPSQVTAVGYDPQMPFSACQLLNGPYDLVICREVLEHCTVLDLRRVVADLVRLSAKYIYVTTRFAQQPTHLLSVDSHDDLDPTHITMLTRPFLRTLFVLEGCKSRYDLEEKMDWQHKGRCLVFEVA